MSKLETQVSSSVSEECEIDSLLLREEGPSLSDFFHTETSIVSAPVLVSAAPSAYSVAFELNSSRMLGTNSTVNARSQDGTLSSSARTSSRRVRVHSTSTNATDSAHFVFFVNGVLWSSIEPAPCPWLSGQVSYCSVRVSHRPPCILILLLTYLCCNRTIGYKLGSKHSIQYSRAARQLLGYE